MKKKNIASKKKKIHSFCANLNPLKIIFFSENKPQGLHAHFLKRKMQLLIHF